jgi:hypothetical protein
MSGMASQFGPRVRCCVTVTHPTLPTAQSPSLDVLPELGATGIIFNASAAPSGLLRRRGPSWRLV